MRSHGVPNFPDPNSKGQLLLPADGSVDLNSLQSARQACQGLMPGGGSGPPSAQDQQKAVEYASCMRSHGVPDFPDPTVLSGGFTVNIPPDADPNSPQYRAAQQACQAFNVLPGGN
jgi:hypothetical protein